MTPEEAKLILAACRADQLDTDNPDVRQALDTAAAIPQLAAWWEAEQAFDRAFTRKLTSIQPPKAIHEAILRGGATIFAARRLITETKSDANTEELIEQNTPSPLGHPNVVPFYQTPADIAALARKHPLPVRRRLWHPMLPWSLAASIVLALLALALFFNPDKLTASDDEELPAFTKAAESLSDNPAPPDQASQQLADMQAYFASHNAPDTDALPPEVGSAKILGESISTWKKDTVSIVRLQDPSGKLTLFILNKQDFPHDDVPSDPATTHDGPETITTWAQGADIYILLRKTP